MFCSPFSKQTDALLGTDHLCILCFHRDMSHVSSFFFVPFVFMQRISKYLICIALESKERISNTEKSVETEVISCSGSPRNHNCP